MEWVEEGRVEKRDGSGNGGRSEGRREGKEGRKKEEGEEIRRRYIRGSWKG